MPALNSAYFIDTWPKVKEAEDEVQEFQHLPYDLRRRVAWHITAHVLQTNKVFMELPEHSQKSLASRLWPMFVPRGVNLVAQGGPADCIWVLQEGAAWLVCIQHTCTPVMIDMAVPTPGCQCVLCGAIAAKHWRFLV